MKRVCLIHIFILCVSIGFAQERPADIGIENVDSFKNEAFNYLEKTSVYKDSTESLNAKIQGYKEDATGLSKEEVQDDYDATKKQSQRGQFLLAEASGLLLQGQELLSSVKSIKPLTKIPKATKSIKNSIDAINQSKTNLTDASTILATNLPILASILREKGVEIEEEPMAEGTESGSESQYLTDDRVEVPEDIGVDNVDTYKNQAFSYKVETLLFNDSVKLVNDKISAYSENPGESETDSLKADYWALKSQTNRSKTLLDQGLALLEEGTGLLTDVKSIKPITKIVKATKQTKEAIAVLNTAKDDLGSSSTMIGNNLSMLTKELTARGVSLDDLNPSQGEE